MFQVQRKTDSKWVDCGVQVDNFGQADKIESEQLIKQPGEYRIIHTQATAEYLYCECCICNKRETIRQEFQTGDEAKFNLAEWECEFMCRECAEL